MDKDTQEVYSEQRSLQLLVNHDGWKIARRMFGEKVMELQNAFSIEDSEPQKMLIDLQARKIASETLFDFMRQIEGSASQASETKNIETKSYIVRE